MADKKFNNLNPDFNVFVDECSVSKKSVVQVCCNNGIDLLSIKNKGAGYCLGIDGSKAFIEKAISLAKSVGQPDIEFFQPNVYQLTEKYKNMFDVVIITVGVLNWMPDLYRFISIFSSLLVPGDSLLLEEMHPVLNIFEEGKPSYINSSYYNSKPFVEQVGWIIFLIKNIKPKKIIGFIIR